MQITATGVNFNFTDLGITPEQGKNSKVALKAVLDSLAKEPSRQMAVTKFSDLKARGLGFEQGSRRVIYNVQIVLSPSEYPEGQEDNQPESTETQTAPETQTLTA